MPIAYTNRKGRTSYLCQGLTKTGKARYYFTPELKDGCLDQIPEGYHISESVNAVVSLVKDRPQLILPQEVASIEAALKRHPKGRDYRAAVKKNQIIIYERLGPDEDILSDLLENFSPLPTSLVKKRIQEVMDKMARYSPVMRFILVDPKERCYSPERWCSFGDIDNWIGVGESGKLDKLVRRLIPKLGTDDFFKLC